MSWLVIPTIYYDIKLYPELEIFRTCPVLNFCLFHSLVHPRSHRQFLLNSVCGFINNFYQISASAIRTYEYIISIHEDRMILFIARFSRYNSTSVTTRSMCTNRATNMISTFSKFQIHFQNGIIISHDILTRYK